MEAKTNEKRHRGIVTIVIAGLAILAFVAWIVYALPCPVNPTGCIP